MLITLYRGAVVINLNDKLMMPSRDVTTLPKFNESEVLWVDKDLLMRYSQYMNDKSLFAYDFEYMVELSGALISKLTSFKFKHIDNEDIDLSLGKFAQYLQALQVKEEAKRAKKLQEQFAKASTSSSFEFEDDDEEDSYDEDYDDEDYDYQIA